MSDEKIDEALNDIDNYVLEVEGDEAKKVSQFINKWENEQCRQSGISRTQLLRQLQR